MLSSLVLWGAIHHAVRYDAPFNPRMLPFFSIAAILAFSFAMMVRKAQREYLHGALSHGIITKENEEERSRVFLDNLWNILQDWSMALSAGISLPTQCNLFDPPMLLPFFLLSFVQTCVSPGPFRLCA